MIINDFLLKDIVVATSGEILQTEQTIFRGVSTNSKELQTEAIFIPLKGERFDAHDFIGEAISNGAKLILTAKDLELEDGVTYVKVTDTLEALQSLANFWRKKLNKKVLSITGSNGKTTTKEFLQQILSTKYKVCYSAGSFNNHWGLPLSILKLKTSDDLMITEMGMNSPGEIAALCKIAEPNFAVVTNVGRAHLELMGSLENIAEEKKQIYVASPNAVKIFNLDNSYTKQMYGYFKKDEKRLTFSLSDSVADVYLYKKQGNHVGGIIGGIEGEADFAVFGEQNLMNLAAAATMALAYSMPAKDIWQGIKNCKTIWGRNQWVGLESGAKAVFDAYNANPESMAALLKNITNLEMSGKAYLILGDMLELGNENEAEHIHLAQQVAAMPFAKVYFIGKNARLFKSHYKEKNLVVTDTYEEKLAFELEPMLSTGDIVFLKASRGIKLENFLLDLRPTEFTSK